MHVCPMVTVIVPHVGGPITAPGAPTVLIGMLPAARIGDIVTCVGPPDVIVMGATTILIGGQPAARITSQCAHGGIVVLGCFTVFLGDAGGGGGGGGGSGGAGAGGAAAGAAQAGQARTAADQLAQISNGTSPEIKVEGSDAFKTQTLIALSRILNTPSGQAWMKNMQANGKSVTITEGGPGVNDCTAANGTNASNGTGTNSTIRWDPNTTSLGGFPPDSANCGNDTILFHEMTHGMHNGNGTAGNGPYDSFAGQQGASDRTEERQTVGASPNVPQPDGTTRPVQQPGPPPSNAPAGSQTDYNGTSTSGNYPTENSYRRDKGIPERPSYYPTNWPGGAPW